MNLHVIFRSTAKANRKPRPAYFSKLTCLLSLVRAARPVGVVELIYLNDGHITGQCAEVMSTTGEVIERTFDLQHSYWGALDIVAERPWPGSDLVYLCEDDHLHQPHALEALVAAARDLRADYFGLYASIDGRMPNGAPLAVSMPRGWRPSERDEVIDGVHWRRAVSTTSTFAARVGALRADRRLHRIGFRTSGYDGSHDSPISYAYQGFVPFPWARPIRNLFAAHEPFERRVKHGVWDYTLNVLALSARRRRHELIGATPSLACHLEPDVIAEGVDWAGVAADTTQWARDQGLA